MAQARWSFRVPLFLLAAWTLCWPQAARADYQLCNRTSYVLEAALAIESGGATATQGWFQVAPGLCSVILTGAWTGERYFIHTRTPEFYHEVPEADQVSRMFCVKGHDFLIPGAERCSDADGGLAAFSEFLPDRDIKVTTNELSDDNRFTLEQARVAGVQRLLTLLGFGPLDIDGRAGEATQLAIADFIAAAGVAEHRTEMTALMNELVKAAQASASASGLTLCNRTPYRLAAAIATESDDGGLTSQGWFELEARACERVLAEPVKGRLHAFAEAVDDKGAPVEGDDGPLVWSGGTELCTRDFRFAISEHGDCGLRGLRATGFRSLPAGAATAYTLSFTKANAGHRDASISAP